MLRRHCMAAGVLWLAGACASGYGEGRSITVALARVKETVNTRFPREFRVLNLLRFVLQAPRLSTLPQHNALEAALPIRANGPLLGREYPARAIVRFMLRYEASDRTLRATDLSLRELQTPDLPPAAAAELGPQLTSAVQRAMDGEVVLYRLQDKDLALMDNLGLQPGRITVVQEGLRVELVARPLSEQAPERRR